jgi:MFS family permease
VGLLLGGVLTQTQSWRWCLYVNLLFAIPAAIAASRLVDRGGAQRPRPRIDFAGVAAASAGFFCLVYGFSNAESHAWSAGGTIAAFTASTVLLASFVIIEYRAERPLLPLRIVADRSRGGAYASMAIVGAALFSVFLFMTFYMQQILRFSPVKTGLGLDHRRSKQSGLTGDTDLTSESDICRGGSSCSEKLSRHARRQEKTWPRRASR